MVLPVLLPRYYTSFLHPSYTCHVTWSAFRTLVCYLTTPTEKELHFESQMWNLVYLTTLILSQTSTSMVGSGVNNELGQDLGGIGNSLTQILAWHLPTGPERNCDEHESGQPLVLNPSNAELNPIRHLLALVWARHIVHVSRIRVNCKCKLINFVLFNFIFHYFCFVFVLPFEYFNSSSA